MNMNIARDLAIFIIFVLLGILAVCGYFAYADSVKTLFAPLFKGAI